MLKPIAVLIAAATFAMPATAKVDPDSVALLQTLQEYGVTVHYNSTEGCTGGHHGSYNTAKVMHLCYRGRQPTAGDHNTLRHEAFHYLQHCANERRGGQGLRPLAINPSQRQQFVLKALDPRYIESIKESYPARAHQIELEAFAAAETYTARELITYIRSWCTT
jgi:hypothetical protein